jgi:hypothetical protein
VISLGNAIVHQDPNNPTSTSPTAKTRSRLAVTSISTGSVVYNAANIIVAQGDINPTGTDPLAATRSPTIFPLRRWEKKNTFFSPRPCG